MKIPIEFISLSVDTENLNNFSSLESKVITFDSREESVSSILNFLVNQTKTLTDKIDIIDISSLSGNKISDVSYKSEYDENSSNLELKSFSLIEDEIYNISYSLDLLLNKLNSLIFKSSKLSIKEQNQYDLFKSEKNFYVESSNKVKKDLVRSKHINSDLISENLDLSNYEINSLLDQSNYVLDTFLKIKNLVTTIQNVEQNTKDIMFTFMCMYSHLSKSYEFLDSLIQNLSKSSFTNWLKLISTSYVTKGNNIRITRDCGKLIISAVLPQLPDCDPFRYAQTPQKGFENPEGPKNNCPGCPPINDDLYTEDSTSITLAPAETTTSSSSEVGGEPETTTSSSSEGGGEPAATTTLLEVTTAAPNLYAYVDGENAGSIPNLTSNLAVYQPKKDTSSMYSGYEWNSTYKTQIILGEQIASAVHQKYINMNGGNMSAVPWNSPQGLPNTAYNLVENNLNDAITWFNQANKANNLYYITDDGENATSATTIPTKLLNSPNGDTYILHLRLVEPGSTTSASNFQQLATMYENQRLAGTIKGWKIMTYFADTTGNDAKNIISNAIMSTLGI